MILLFRLGLRRFVSKLQNRADRIITHSSFDAPGRPLIEGIGWKTIDELITCESKTMVFQGQIKAKDVLLTSTIYSREISKFQTKFRYGPGLIEIAARIPFSGKFFKKIAQAKEPETSRGVPWNESIESLQSCERM